jgi:hypothetical protein
VSFCGKGRIKHDISAAESAPVLRITIKFNTSLDGPLVQLLSLSKQRLRRVFIKF